MPNAFSFSSDQSVFGLDIGFETLKLVELKKSKKSITLVGAIELALTERILEKDNFKNKAATANLIKDACRRAKPSPISAKKIVTALPETFVFSKTIQMPKMTDEEYKNAIPIEAAQYIPIPVDQTYIDFQKLIVHPDAPLVDILIVAAPKKLVDDYVEMTNMAGLELFALETKPIAVGRSVAMTHSIDGSVIVEIGTEISRISIWDNNSVRLITSVNTGKNQISAIMGEGAIALEGNIEACAIASNIVDEIINAIKYHQNRDYNPKPVVKILLCGSGAKIPGIVEFFEKEAKIETEIVTPYLNGKITLGTEFITAYGLALRGEKE